METREGFETTLDRIAPPGDAECVPLLVEEINGTNCKTYLLVAGSDAALVDPVRERVDTYRQILRRARPDAADGARDAHARRPPDAEPRRKEALGVPVVHAPREPEPARRPARRGRRRARARRRDHRGHRTRPGTRPTRSATALPGAVLTGDTLLIGGSGRTDFPGGDAGAQYRRGHRAAVRAARRDGRVAGARLQGAAPRRRSAPRSARTRASRGRRATSTCADGKPRPAVPRQDPAVAPGEPVGLRGRRGRLPAGDRGRRRARRHGAPSSRRGSARMHRRSSSTCASPRSSSASSATSSGRSSCRSTRSSTACPSSPATSIATSSSCAAPARAARARPRS